MPKAKYSLEARRQYGVYAIVNIVTGQTYIGQTEYYFSVRWALHEGELRKGRHGNPALQRDYDTYGPDAFEFRILEGARSGLDKLDCKAAERRHIELATAPLYNARKRKNTHWLLR